ncbi:FecR domain-containing protein [Sphingobacterium sp.]|uniref:FecR family protein n=1 Tax=Sphingobacterium sp. TaxID=341027 RepID=UPI0028A02DCD|nr:FecR domain-containing protein [Sphingobacterium sp.]
MEHLPDYIAHLIWLDLQDELTSEQRQELDKWIDQSPYHSIIAERTKNQANLSKDLAIYQKFNAEIAWEKFDSHTVSAPKAAIKKLNPQLIGWVAACLLLLSTCLTIYLNNTQVTKYVEKPITKITPATKGALLILSDGKKILLDTVKDGLIKLENGAVAEVANGQLSYRQSDNLNVTNTITTNSGRHYQMTLADGTKVWLNANSSISFPSAFQGNTRNVMIQGEVYFEVMKNKNKPFIVAAPNGLKIEVTGTKFNLNTYANENTWKTTLIEGHVNVHLDGRSLALIPGAQARVDRTKRNVTIIRNIDPEQAIAWKNGLFNFEGATLPEIMRQIERWYAIKVDYKGPVQKIDFFGEISRNESLDDIIRALQESGLKLKLNRERRLITVEQ